MKHLRQKLEGPFYILVLLMFFGVVAYFADKHNVFTPSSEKQFSRAMQDAIRDRKPVVKVNDLTSFEWNEVCKLGAYTEKEHIEKLIGDHELKTSIPKLDMAGRWALLFVDEEDDSAHIMPIKTALPSHQSHDNCYGTNASMQISYPPQSGYSKRNVILITGPKTRDEAELLDR